MTFFRTIPATARRAVVLQGAMTEARSYRLISGDSHVNEPGDLWTARVPAQFRDRAPRIERFDAGRRVGDRGCARPDQLRHERVRGLATRARCTRGRASKTCATAATTPRRAPRRWTSTASTPRCCIPRRGSRRRSSATKDVDFHLALVRAYNDWLSEYVAYAPERFARLGVAAEPRRRRTRSPRSTACSGRPGIRGVMLGLLSERNAGIDRRRRRGVGTPGGDAGIPLNIHVSLSQNMPAAHRAPLPGYGRFFDAPNRIVQMIFAGVFDRFPDLDGRDRRGRLRLGPVLQGTDRQQLSTARRRSATSRSRRCRASTSSATLHFTYLTDTFGIAKRHAIGVERILWSSDYPAHLERLAALVEDDRRHI